MTASPLTIEAVFVEALELPEAERAAFVARRCDGDASLAARVHRLLAAHEHTLAKGFLDTPTLPDRPQALRPAARLGRYAILDELGRGGMGVVYAAFDAELGRKVAVKQLLGGAPARLELEARALARLQHPNVVAVHDVGTTDGQLFVAMELVAGEPLSRWADSHGSIDVLRALIAAGRGLAHAHHEGILHRDFKPANVLVDAAGRPRVADFGLALDKELAVHDASPMGTPGFMAPEIFDGKPASVASDIYAYCRTLADLVVARGDAPHWLAPLVDRGLADDPAARWKSLDELLAAIERELGVDPDRDPRTGRTGRRRWFAVVAAILVGLPVLGAVAKGVTIDLEDAFYTSLVPPITIALAAALFWRTMATTAFNRSGVLRLLAVTATITASHGLALALATSVATAFVADLLILGAFLLGNAVSELDRVYFVSAVTSFAGAAAVAAFPAYAPFIFIAVATGQLPFVYFHWVSRGARPAE